MAAFEDYQQGKTNVLVALRDDAIVTVPIDCVADKPRFVDVQGELVRFARKLGVCLGD